MCVIPQPFYYLYDQAGNRKLNVSGVKGLEVLRNDECMIVLCVQFRNLHFTVGVQYYEKM